MNINITIIILNWNGKADTFECLDSIFKIDYPNFNVIVVDNGSTDDSVVTIKAAYPDVHILQNTSNLGFAEGNNIGIRYALEHGADAVLILNNDTIVDPNILQAFSNGYSMLPKAGILGAVSLYYDKPNIVWAAGAQFNRQTLNFDFDFHNIEYTEITKSEFLKRDYIIGCGMFVHKEVIKTVGLMNSDYFLNAEEFDWCRNMIANNLENYTIMDAKLWHKISSSFGGMQSPLRNYFLTRNFLLWTKIHEPDVFFRVLIKSLNEFIPELIFLNTKTRKTLKQRYWEFISWVKQIKNRSKDTYYLAQYYGILHYFINRFGDCPPELKTRLTQR